MTDRWTAETVAQELLKLMPTLGRLMGHHMRETAGDDVTLMQVMALTKIQDRQLTTSELAKQRNVSLQSASVLVQSLVEHGWVVRLPDPTDRRQSLLQLTPEGLAHHKAATGRLINYLAAFLGALTDEQIEAAQVLLPALQDLFAHQKMTEDTRER